MPTFRPHEHLRKTAEFQRVYDQRSSAADDRLLVFAAANGLTHSRIGLSVSKKFSKRAVRRNRMRRLYREAFRLLKAELPSGIDLIMIPRGLREPTLAEVMQSLPKLTRQACRRMRKSPPAAISPPEPSPPPSSP